MTPLHMMVTGNSLMVRNKKKLRKVTKNRYLAVSTMLECNIHCFSVEQFSLKPTRVHALVHMT